jgi:hypothetical protein
MKSKINILLPFFGLMLLLIASCTPENKELGALLDKSALKFSVSVDPSNPNKFILTSQTPNVTPYWVTPSGKSTKVTDTIDIPFPGTDTIYYSVESAGGIVTADPYIFKVNTLDKDYVSSTMWTNLTGGYGNSKTWVLDVNASGTSKYFNGPLYFAGANYSWEWDAAWYDWIMPKGDYGTMTFDLKGNANFKSNNLMLGTSTTGTFMLYTDASTISTFGAQLLHDNSQGASVANWNTKLLIKTLATDHMQIVVIRNDGTWLIYNYITLDYYNSH